MAAKRSKYEDYDKEDKGKLRKILKRLLVALAIVIGVCILLLALEDVGLFPGNILNRVPVSSYINEKYGDAKISYSRYDANSGYYLYNCTIDGKSCEFAAKGLKVRIDGYYNDYGRNKNYEKTTEEYLCDILNQKWAEQYTDNTAVWKCSIDIPLSDSAYPSGENEATGSTQIQNALKTYGGSLYFTIDVHGENISMDDYKGVFYRAVNILQKEMDNRPQSLQMFYYRKADGNDVMQYESSIKTFQFEYNEIGIRNATDIHRYVEVNSELKKKANIYYIVKCIFMIVLVGTIIGLSILWGVRRSRRKKRDQNTGI